MLKDVNRVKFGACEIHLQSNTWGFLYYWIQICGQLLIEEVSLRHCWKSCNHFTNWKTFGNEKDYTFDESKFESNLLDNDNEFNRMVHDKSSS